MKIRGIIIAVKIVLIVENCSKRSNSSSNNNRNCNLSKNNSTNKLENYCDLSRNKIILRNTNSKKMDKWMEIRLLIRCMITFIKTRIMRITLIDQIKCKIKMEEKTKKKKMILNMQIIITMEIMIIMTMMMINLPLKNECLC